MARSDFPPGPCRAAAAFCRGVLLVLCCLCVAAPPLVGRALAASAVQGVQRPHTLPVITSAMQRPPGAKQGQGVGQKKTMAKSKPAAARKAAAVKKPAAPRKVAAVPKTAAVMKPDAPRKTAAVAKPATPSTTAAVAKPDAARKPMAVDKPVAARKSAAAVKPAVAGKKNTPSRRHKRRPAGLAGFRDNPFNLEARFLSPKDTEEDATAARLAAKQGKKRAKPQSRLSLKANSHRPSGDRLDPSRGAPFSGGSQTLPYMDKKPAPEVSMAYKLNKKTTTRVVVNPQDEASPLYRPAEMNDEVSAGGMYMDVDLVENIQLTVGGEYSEVENRQRLYGEPQTSQGAAVGLKVNF